MDSFVMPYDPQQMWDRSSHFGASVGAFAKLFSDFCSHLIATHKDQIKLYAGDAVEIGTEQAMSLEEGTARTSTSLP